MGRNFILSGQATQATLDLDASAKVRSKPRADRADRAEEQPDRPARTDRSGLAEQAAAMLLQLADSATPEDIDRIREDVRAIEARVSSLEEHKPKLVQFQIGTYTGPVMADVRPEIPGILRKIAAGFENFYLCGPAGTGKSTIPKTIAEAIGRRFGGQSFGPDTNSAALIGGPTVAGGWNEPAFIDFFEHGGVYLFDEIDAADPSVLLVLNEALANGYLYLPRHPDHSRRIIRRHKDLIIFAAANTWGNGPTAEYVGRAQQDAAFVNRFALAKHFIGYDRNIERQIMGLDPVRTGPVPGFDPPADPWTILQRLWAIRDTIAANRIRRVCGTREIVAAAKLARAGYSEREIVEELSIDWTPDERRKCGIE